MTTKREAYDNTYYAIEHAPAQRDHSQPVMAGILADTSADYFDRRNPVIELVITTMV